MKRPIYLDNGMTTRPSSLAVSRMLPYLSEKWGSPSAPHQFGQQLYPALEESYRALYALVGAKRQDSFVFTSSGAEAINHVIATGYHDITCSTGKNQFLTSKVDEAPAILAIGRLEQLGCVGKMVAVDSYGRVDIQALKESITPRAALLSLSWANGLTGVIQPIADIAALCRDRGIALHLDATHVLGRLFFSWEEVGAQYITFNGDQLHATKGTGGLFIKEGVKSSSFILGGIEQGGRRAGPLDVPALVALGVAAQQLVEARELMCTEVARLRNKLEEGIVAGYPEACVLFCEAERLPCRTAIAFPGMVSEALLWLLSRRGVYGCIGGGSYQQISLVLSHAAVASEQVQSAISFCLSRETSEEEIDEAIEIIVGAAKKLRKLSVSFIPGGNHVA